jgi:hypothetical protein
MELAQDRVQWRTLVSVTLKLWVVLPWSLLQIVSVTFSLCGICGGQSGTGTGFSPNPVFPCQYNFTAVPY